MAGDLWRLMQADHDAVWDLLNALTGGGRAPVTEPGDRHRTAQRLVALLSQHELTEELVVWPAVRRLCADGDKLADGALKQESEVKWALNELSHTSAASAEFTECVNSLAGLCRAHFALEENQAWPELAGALMERQLHQLTHRWRAARNRAPTRPHPHLPAHPAALAAVGPAVAVLDRTRDALVR